MSYEITVMFQLCGLKINSEETSTRYEEVAEQGGENGDNFAGNVNQ